MSKKIYGQILNFPGGKFHDLVVKTQAKCEIQFYIDLKISWKNVKSLE